MAHREHYNKAGVRIPSVTEVLNLEPKPWLEAWIKKHGVEHCERVKKETAEFGTAFHEAIEAYLLGNENRIDLYPEAKRYLDDNVDTIEAIELSLSGDEYGGTMDFLGRMVGGNGLWVVDWKTTKAFRGSLPHQLAAYAHLYNEYKGLTWKSGVNQGAGVRYDRTTGKMQTKIYQELKPHYRPFSKLLRQWWRANDAVRASEEIQKPGLEHISGSDEKQGSGDKVE